jgi:Fe-S-cluster formation regulator IscX/YfhJ
VATERDWATGYLAQARADLAGVARMGSASPSCAAMLWQMVFEKYAKAALLRQNEVPLSKVTTSHKAASKMVAFLRRKPKVFAVLGGAPVWEDVLRLVVALEAAQPDLAPREGPMLEYPWQNTRGEIQWPARDLHVARELGDAKSVLAPRMLRFTRLLDMQFDVMFPP